MTHPHQPDGGRGPQPPHGGGYPPSQYPQQPTHGQSQYPNAQPGAYGSQDPYHYGGPGDGGYGEHPRRSRTGLWVVVGILATLMLLGGAIAVWFATQGNEAGPQPAPSASSEEVPGEDTTEPEVSEEAPSEDQSAAEAPASEPAGEPSSEADTEASAEPSEEATEAGDAEGAIEVPQEVGPWRFFGSDTGASYHHQDTNATVNLDLESSAQAEVLKADLSDVVEFDGGLCGVTGTGEAVRCYLVSAGTPEGQEIAMFSTQVEVHDMAELAEAIAQH